MPTWMKKSLIILISIATFGLVTPSDFNFDKITDNSSKEKSSIQDVQKDLHATNFDTFENQQSVIEPEKAVDALLEQGISTAYNKFGEKILPKIDREFHEVILPKLEEAIQETLKDLPAESMTTLSVSNLSTNKHSEKIFHIFNEETGEDVIRFHVRKDRPPLDGYYFNFHYHTYHDQFQSHHELGSIYWSKNTPPNWNTMLS
ncbi:hypothetical protein Q75_08185 [Bacillus coahuilensis p1.1.43]|uniref:Cell division protein FtsK n=1 Tax=Bacillus coahuilensis p1.1.43 TaxID=1150625 RepID=A0A147K8G2_9BACI|nr:YpjP family protein [Bacillus coahuilensis]KUP06496.1 hypothetical protein Q75_08185 [Bacillus coahuilensis p1.1.43]